MIKILAVVLICLTITTHTLWTPEWQSDSQQQVPAASCRINQTICRQPPIKDDFNYTGIIRSGYLRIDTKPGSAIGFIFYGKLGVKVSDQLKNYPTLVIFGGGPGASSQFNNLREIGPFLIQKIFSPTIQDNKYTWARQANLLFIDQPVGTGVSCATSSSHIPDNMADITKDFYKAFYQLFSEQVDGCFNSKKLKIPPSSPFYFVGEGYGGKFASAFAAKITAEKKTGGPITGLKGILIGGGLNAPFRLMSEIGNYGFSMSLFDYQERIRVEKILLRASFNQENKEWIKLKNDFERVTNYIYERTGVSYYDITKDGFDEDLVKEYFANSTNLGRFGFEQSIPYQSLSKEVYDKLSTDFMKDQISSIQYLLNEQLPVLIYQGQDDAYANPTGTNRWVDQINFSNSRQFRNTNFQAFRINGQMMGSKKSVGKLTLQIINDAGHHVGQDNGQASYYMIRDFLRANGN